MLKLGLKFYMKRKTNVEKIIKISITWKTFC